MEENSTQVNQLSKVEIKRKYIHLASIAIPIIYYFISFATFFVFFGAILAIWAFIDMQRQKKPEIKLMLDRYFGDLFRESEATTYSGATYLGIGMLLTAIFFSKHTAIMAMSILAICDSVASLVGLRYGHIRIGDKTLEGSAGFFVSGLMIVCCLIWLFGFKAIFLWENIIALALTCAAELYSKKLKINDNILIPLIYSIVVSILETAL